MTFVVAILSVAFLLVGCGWTSEVEEDVSNLEGRKMTVYHSPTCSCCKEYIEYMKQQGVDVKSVERGGHELNRIKKRHGLSRASASCHTSVIGDYVVEGHVPARTVSKLLEEQPEDVHGVTIPGMPQHAPGMGDPIGGDLEILAFDESGSLSGTYETVRY